MQTTDTLTAGREGSYDADLAEENFEAYRASIDKDYGMGSTVKWRYICSVCGKTINSNTRIEGCCE